MKDNSNLENLFRFNTEVIIKKWVDSVCAWAAAKIKFYHTGR